VASLSADSRDATRDAAPGRSQLGPAVDRFDAWADAQLELLRGHAVADQVFTTASHVGDFSVVWHALSLGRGVVKRRPDQVVVLAALLAAESLVVNQGVKRLFRRERPTTSGDLRLPVRQPSTSAFPSGHASSAAIAATILTSWVGPRLGVLGWAFAAVVGPSRAHVRIHHASDVVGGAVVGTALGLGVRAAVRRLR
jgi:membrane-associated phospholipid phosphatase